MDAARVGVEGDRQGPQAACAGELGELAEHGLVAAVHAVEVAERDGGVTEIGWDLVDIPENFHFSPLPRRR